MNLKKLQTDGLSAISKARNGFLFIHSFRIFESEIQLMKKQQELSNGANIIDTIEISTPLGLMLAGATSQGICILEFINRVKLEKEIIDLQKLLNAVMQPGHNPYLDQLANELAEYFEGRRKVFSVPLHIPGNEFSQNVWKTLQEIPYGQTCSYKQQADKMNNPKAIRAIATTNGRNRLAIIIPCHRVIGSDGKMIGYAAGVEKKKWLLKFERSNSEVPADSLF